jgi:hypothetical protein
MLRVKGAGDGGTRANGGEKRKLGSKRIASYWIGEEGNREVR